MNEILPFNGLKSLNAKYRSTAGYGRTAESRSLNQIKSRVFKRGPLRQYLEDGTPAALCVKAFIRV